MSKDRVRPRRCENAAAVNIALALQVAGCVASPAQVPSPSVVLVAGAGSARPPAMSRVPRPTSIAPGGSFTCARASDGTVRCWGANDNGQLGDGTKTQHSTPTPVPGLTNVIQIATGIGEACALRADRTVWCWGENFVGLERVSIEAPGRLTPTRIMGLRDAVEVAIGADFACVREAVGTVKCWGYNAHGQIGDGTTEPHLAPTPVHGLRNAVGLSLEMTHACARLDDNSVTCWGDGHRVPQVVPGLTGVLRVAAGAADCALVTDGRVFCWGSNSFGSVGDGTTTRRDIPVVVAGIRGAVAIATGGGHACALLADATVRCWGWNAEGQLGDGTVASRTEPVAVRGLTGISALACGERHTCALTNEGGVSCWGRDADGQLGLGPDVLATQAFRAIPAPIRW